MVWETRKVRKFYLLPLFPANVKNAPGYALPTYLPHKTSHNGSTHPGINTRTSTSHPTPPFSFMLAWMLIDRPNARPNVPAGGRLTQRMVDDAQCNLAALHGNVN